MVEGELLIRGSAEPYALTNPTSVSGTVDTGEGGTGAITGASFSTPTVSFERVALGLPVAIDAAFTEVDPASGTGAIDPGGNVVVQVALTVDLDIKVGNPVSIRAACRATPVVLTLNSTAPYDPETGRVTLEDADFSVPQVVDVSSGSCPGVVSEQVDLELAGSGHSLSLTLEGDIELPPVPGCPTITTVAVTPEDQAPLGNDVTYMATVAQDPDFVDDPLCDEAGSDVVPTGFVDFLDGSRTVGSMALDDTGAATVTTDTLPAGTRTLSARYRGAEPYAASTSTPMSYRVVAPPAITTTLPAHIPAGGVATEFDLTVTNTGMGDAVTNVRVDLAFQRTHGGATLTPAQVTLEYKAGTTWVPVTLSGAGAVLFGPTGPLTGAPLPVGDEVTRRMRISVLASATPGPVSVIYRVYGVDPTTGAPAPAHPAPPGALAQLTRPSQVVEAARRPTTLRLGTSSGQNPLQPHTLRQGHTLRLLSPTVLPQITAAPATGLLEVFIDGRRVNARQDNAPLADGYSPRVPVGRSVELLIPDDVLPGTRQVRVQFLGDALYEPSQWSGTIEVLPAVGPAYSCVASFLFPQLVTVNVVAHANLPASVPAGSSVPLGQLEVRVVTDRVGSLNFTQFFPNSTPVSDPPTDAAPLSAITFGFGPLNSLGVGSATAMGLANRSPMTDATRPVDPAPDHIISFQGEAGSVTVDGAPGDEVPVTLDSFGFDGVLSGFPVNLSCSPVGEAISFGSVAIAGTSLAVSAPGGVARAGDEIDLTATVAPAGSTGTVEFRSGTDTVGVAQVRNGTASAVATLTEGTHALTARFFSGVGEPSTTSDPVALMVLPALDCAPFAEEGDGAVVRLAYMELLRRCPDQAGFDYWVDRLDVGTTPEVFARTIARTPEALGVVVDDAYRTMLGRGADSVGRAFWVERLRTGSGRYDQLLADLAASDEFWRRAGSTNAGFVTRVYGQLLGRAPDPAGLDYWVGRLLRGASPRTLVLSLANLDEPLGVVVVSSYDEILSRTPNQGERTSGMAFLRLTGDRSGLYAQLIGRPEFADRAQSFPNPED